jgi:hypothetical protein
MAYLIQDIPQLTMSATPALPALKETRERSAMEQRISPAKQASPTWSIAEYLGSSTHRGHCELGQARGHEQLLWLVNELRVQSWRPNKDIIWAVKGNPGTICDGAADLAGKAGVADMVNCGIGETHRGHCELGQARGHEQLLWLVNELRVQSWRPKHHRLHYLGR